MRPTRGRGRPALVAVATGAALVLLTTGCDPSPSSGLADPSPAAPGSSPIQETPGEPDAPVAACTGGAGTHRDFLTGTAVSVRFCPVRQTGVDRALTGDDALTTGVPELVSGWRERTSTAPVHGCPMTAGAVSYRVEVAFADGTVAVVRGNTGACTALLGRQQSVLDGGLVFDDLTRALAGQAALRVERTGPAPELRCPRTAAVPPRNRDGLVGADEAQGPVLTLPATGGLVCHYRPQGRRPRARPLAPASAERVRVALAGSFDPPGGGHVRYGHRAPQPAYVVLLHDRTGNVRAFRISGPQHRVVVRQGVPGTPVALGKAGERLLHAVTGRYF